MLEHVKIVLVETSHTGNMGSVARAMKTMGLSQLVLVNPVHKPDAQATALAAGADDILGAAQYSASLADAVADCTLVIGTSARPRSIAWPALTPRELGQKIVTEGQRHPVAVVFGRERTGLTNEELQRCHYHVAVDANPLYSSLNLAMAVQLMAYEIRTAWLDTQDQSTSPNNDPIYPPHEDLERFYTHLEQALLATGFLRADHPGPIVYKLRQMYQRMHPDQAELHLLRGILTSIQKYQGQAADTHRNKG